MCICIYIYTYIIDILIYIYILYILYYRCYTHILSILLSLSLFIYIYTFYILHYISYRYLWYVYTEYVCIYVHTLCVSVYTTARCWSLRHRGKIYGLCCCPGRCVSVGTLICFSFNVQQIWRIWTRKKRSDLAGQLGFEEGFENSFCFLTSQTQLATRKRTCDLTWPDMTYMYVCKSLYVYI